MKFKWLRCRAALAAAAFFALYQAATASLRVDSGDVSKDGGTYTSIRNSTDGAAVYATGSRAVLHGSNLVIDDGGFTSVAPVGANSGAVIILTGTTVVTGAHGLSTYGANSIITMTGGRIDGTLEAASVRTGGTITLNDVTVSSDNTSSGAIKAHGGTLNLNGGSVSTSKSSGSGARAIYIADGGTANIDGTSISSVGTNSEAIIVMQGTLKAKNFTIDTSGSGSYGVNVNDTAMLTNGSIHTSGEHASGIMALPNVSASLVTVDRLTIETEGLNAHGIFADSNSTVTATNTSITVNRAFGLYAQNAYNFANGGVMSYSNGSITVNGAGGVGVLAVTSGSRIDLDAVAVKTTANNADGLYSYSSAVLTAKNSSVQTQGAGSHGLFVGSGASATLTDTTINTTGTDAFGLVFYGVSATNTISVTGGSVVAQNGAAVVANGGTDVLDLKDTTVSGNGLLFAVADYNASGTVAGAKMTVTADNSVLTGGARMSARSTNNVTLNNGSTWTLTPAADGTVDSAVTSLTVNNATVSFALPGGGNFQTLTTGAWNADGATLNMNTLLNAGGALSNQQTDRLLVNGDVTGTTMMRVTGVAGSPGGGTSLNGQNLAGEGISIIQVSGASTAGAFQLLGGYTTVNGMPYQYTLHAYGNGAADASQRLVAGSGDYWDYRLQSVYVELPLDADPPPGPGLSRSAPPGPRIPELAPQAASYLVAPVALFQAGLQDVSNLHRRLGEIRGDRAAGRNDDSGEFFLRAYGGIYDYGSNRNAYSYGYDADIDYAAAQLGGNFHAFEKGDSITRLGLSGSIGSLTFDPKNVRHDSKGEADTWSVSAHATYLHDSGFHVDGIGSAGAFDGEVSTSLRGETASLSGTSFALSLESGYPFALGYGLTLEPQAQLVYQRLVFERQYDIDNFVVALGDRDQMMGRLGARLTKSSGIGQDRTLAVYAKASVLHAFSSGGSVFLGDAFRLGTFGTAVEGGMGVNATVSNGLALFADAAYQQEVGESGVSGVSLTGGLRYAF